MTDTFAMRGQTSITIRNRAYTFTGNSINSGARANIMKLKDSLDNHYALKVFRRNYYKRYNINTEQTRNTYIQDIPGLEWVTDRIMINTHDDAALIAQHPLLEHAILMPWFDEQTWDSWSAIKFKLTSNTSLLPPQSILNSIALQLADAVVQLGDFGLAHGDINDNNILVDINTGTITIIDIEDMYMHGATDMHVGGTNGYRFNQTFNAWTPDADKFSTALLISEIVAKRETMALGIVRDEGYFTQDEIDDRDTDCKAYKALDTSLAKIDTTLHQLFLQAWQATDITHCPEIYDWLLALGTLGGANYAPQQTPTPVPPQTAITNAPVSSLNAGQQKPLQSWRDEHAKSYTPRTADSNHPSLILFVLDHSNSMKNDVHDAGQTISRADRMYNMVGELLAFLKDKSQKGSIIAPRYHIGIMVYGKTCLNLLQHLDISHNISQSVPQDIMPARYTGIWQLPTLIEMIGGNGDAPTIAAFFKSLYPTITKLIETNDTYMTEVFMQIHNILQKQEIMYEYQSCAAPLVFHITDGSNTDPRDVVPAANKLKELKTQMGGHLLMSTTYIGQDIIPPPTDISMWPGINASTMFKDGREDTGNLLSAISSPIPDNLRKLINNYDEDTGIGIREYNLQPDSRMLFPGNQTAMISLSLTAASATVISQKP